ncbi:hypothetical protein FQZ97_1094180 [compost metagenome]
MLDDVEAAHLTEVRKVFSPPGREIVETDDRVPQGKKSFAKMGPEKSAASGHQYSLGYACYFLQKILSADDRQFTTTDLTHYTPPIIIHTIASGDWRRAVTESYNKEIFFMKNSKHNPTL